MNKNNDLTFRSIFIKNRTAVALQDEHLYNFYYKNYNNNNYFKLFQKPHFMRMFSTVDKTKNHIFSKPPSQEPADDPVIILNRFLGEYSMYVKGLTVAARNIYREWSGDDDSICDCCGRYKTILTSGISRHHGYLCQKCSDRFYNRDALNIDKNAELFPKLREHLDDF